MSHRVQQKAEARAAREAAEHEAAVRAGRRRRLLGFVGVLAIAAVVLVVVILATGGDDEGGDGKASTSENVAMFDGIPQDGEWLGQADAPVVVEEYADLQCPFCAQFATENLPPIVTDFVRAGEARLRLRVVSILGEQSDAAAEVAAAAVLQNKGWQFTEAFFAKQGPENSGYVTDDFLRERLTEAGADVDKAMSDRDGDAAAKLLRESQQAFDDAELGGTPSFRVGPRGGTLKTVEIDKLAETIQSEVEKAAK